MSSYEEEFGSEETIQKKLKVDDEVKSKPKKSPVSKDSAASSPKKKSKKKKGEGEDGKEESKEEKKTKRQSKKKNDDDFINDGANSEDEGATKKKKEKGKDKEKDKEKDKDKDSKPKAKKEKAVKGDGVPEVLEYMKKTNRPYSVQNVYDNLHGKVKKASVQKALDALADAGELQMKEFGKAKVYLLNQGSIPTVDEKDMERLKNQLNKVKKEHDSVNEEVKSLTTMLKDLNSQLTNEQIEEEIKKYKKMLQDISDKLEVYESGNYPKISDEEIKHAEEIKKKYETEEKKRRRICKEMLGSIADASEQKLADVAVNKNILLMKKEMVGIEED